MKQLFASLILVLGMSAAACGQNPAIPPFYQVYGGLFYPSEKDFAAANNAASDFVWGMGMGLPITPDFLFLVADISWFRAKGLTPGTPDVNTETSQNFWHLGLLNKYYLSPTLAFRFQGGLSLNAIERTVTPAGGTAVKTELPRKIGFYGGVGFENMLAGGKLSVFADAVYDYRRSVEREMYGDFGGVRIVAGLAAYWF